MEDIEKVAMGTRGESAEVSSDSQNDGKREENRDNTSFRRRNYSAGYNRNRSNYNSSGSGGDGYRRGNNFRRRRRKVCEFCAEKLDEVDYKDVDRLSKFLTERSKIFSRRSAGTCAKHQRKLAVALKRARHMALLPYCKG